MSDGALRISILGDASQFTKTLAQLQAELEDFQQKLKTATGADIPKYNLEIFGAEKSIKQITEFGKFAEGSLGFYEQLKKQLSEELRVTTNRAEQEQLNKRLEETATIIKEIKSAGIEKPIPVPIVIEPPPPGSIADIKRQISETIKDKEIAIGVNLTNANVKLQGLRNELSVLEKQGIEIEAKPVTPVLENSIQGIKNQIDELNRKKVLIDIANEGEIAEINQQLDGLATKLAKANSVSFDKNGQITQSAGKARQAITSLSLVAQDLPFGFIAIQNNLPAVLQTFTELESKNNGLKATLKELGSALIGPAGIFLAFSAVTSAVTFAIKEYGSLGNAVDALFGKLSKFNTLYMRTAEGLAEYNKNLRSNEEIIGKASGSQQGLISKISALSEVVIDVTQSENDRKKALQELQEIDKERFKNFDIEKGKYAGIEGAVNSLTKSILAKAQADAFAQQFSLASVQFEQQKTATDAALKDLQEFEKKFPGARKELEKYIKLNKDAFEPSAPNSRVAQLQDLELELLNQQNTLKLTGEEWIRLNNLAKLYTKTANSLSTIKPPPDDKAVKKVKEYKEELQGVIPLFDLLLPSKEQFNFDFLKDFFGPNFIKQLKESQRVLNNTQNVLKKFREESGQPNLPSAGPVFIPSYESEKENLRLKELAKEFEDARVVLEEVFFAPLSDLFQNFFDTGKFAFEEFGKSILNTIKSIVSKIIATGIINLLANMLNPLGGIASAAFGGAATGAGGGILGAFKAAFNSILGIGKVANPNFGGVQGGGMQLAGEVVFRQRGSDLIGVINRTNGTINRVG